MDGTGITQVHFMTTQTFQAELPQCSSFSLYLTTSSVEAQLLMCIGRISICHCDGTSSCAFHKVVAAVVPYVAVVNNLIISDVTLVDLNLETSKEQVVSDKALFLQSLLYG